MTFGIFRILLSETVKYSVFLGNTGLNLLCKLAGTFALCSFLGDQGMHEQFPREPENRQLSKYSGNKKLLEDRELCKYIVYSPYIVKIVYSSYR
jgi:hypothetical protein